MGRDRLNIDELFKFYYRPLCLYATHYVQDVEMAKDIVQDCFSSLWEKMNNEKSCEVSNMKAYLYVMVKNRSLDYLSQENLFKSGVSFTELEEKCLCFVLRHYQKNKLDTRQALKVQGKAWSGWKGRRKEPVFPVFIWAGCGYIAGVYCLGGYIS